MRAVTGLLAFALVGAVAACARPDPPLLSLGDRACAPQATMEGAVAVSMGEAPGKSVKIGPASACLISAGRPTTYAVFRLPDWPGPYLATVSSEPVGTALIPPRLTVLDDAGHVVRTVATSGFRTDLQGFTTGLRPIAGDRFMLVEADPTAIGQRLMLRMSARQTGVQVAAAVPIIIVIPANTPAQVTELPTTLSLNGLLRVTATPITRVQ